MAEVNYTVNDISALQKHFTRLKFENKTTTITAKKKKKLTLPVYNSIIEIFVKVRLRTMRNNTSNHYASATHHFCWGKQCHQTKLTYLSITLKHIFLSKNAQIFWKRLTIPTGINDMYLLFRTLNHTPSIRYIVNGIYSTVI